MAQQRVQIVEVSPRDGLQAEERNVPTATKLELLDRLADAGHTVIEATSFVSPTAVPQLADADDLMARLKRRPGVRYPVLVPNEKGLERAVAAGVDEVAVFVSASESYSRKNLRRSRDDAIATALAVVVSAKARRLRVRAYVSMVIADPDDGPTDPAEVANIGARFLAGGADEVSLGDTIGAGTARHVRALLAAHRDAKIPVERLAVHFHDTYGQGLANVLTAIDLGVRVVDTSIGGIGGSPFAKRAGGNLATEDVVWMLDGMGLATGLDVRKLAATTTWMAEQLGRELPGRAARALSS
ncbi:MAG TPA: hydroxymethylglutaryl-CoA lyase [Chloroflexi bacterium]|jgi:hydroxymethylglutaryl-CoA lyase|nr:hydroxymethylglutaryl-CoA lyase [Chloroflexota bacterium]HAL25689.1 hydroxymethylglutaryl-CoA lyase [Chloroflexota bacterium]